MSRTEQIQYILSSNHVASLVEDGKLFALEEFTDSADFGEGAEIATLADWVDVTDWTIGQLEEWLGY